MTRVAVPVRRQLLHHILGVPPVGLPHRRLDHGPAGLDTARQAEGLGERDDHAREAAAGPPMSEPGAEREQRQDKEPEPPITTTAAGTSLRAPTPD